MKFTTLIALGSVLVVVAFVVLVYVDDRMDWSLAETRRYEGTWVALDDDLAPPRQPLRLTIGGRAGSLSSDDEVLFVADGVELPCSISSCSFPPGVTATFGEPPAFLADQPGLDSVRISLEYLRGMPRGWDRLFLYLEDPGGGWGAFGYRRE